MLVLLPQSMRYDVAFVAPQVISTLRGTGPVGGVTESTSHEGDIGGITVIQAGSFWLSGFVRSHCPGGGGGGGFGLLQMISPLGHFGLFAAFVAQA